MPANEKMSSKISTTILIILVLGFVGLGTLLWLRPSAPGKGGMSSSDRRELASRLLGVGLSEEAADQYEMYLDGARLGREDRAKLAFSIGKTYQDQGNLSRAISWYYRAEIFDPHSSLKSEIGSRVVECLEKLGKYQSAQYALESRAGLEKKEAGEKKGGAVVARIGGREVTLGELNEALDKMPEWARKDFEKPGKKADFLKQYVANELMFEKAKKLGYDRDPEIQKQLDMFRKGLLINRVLEGEVQNKVQVSDQDIDLYYRANKEKYMEKDKKDEKKPGRQKNLEEVKEQVRQDLLREKLNEKFNELVQTMLAAEKVELHPEALQQ